MTAASIGRHGGRSVGLLPWVALVAPAMVAAQPLLPKFVQFISIYGRLIVAPVLMLALVPAAFNWPALLGLLAIAAGTSLPEAYDHPREFTITLLSLFSSIVAFRFGSYSAVVFTRRFWLALAAGTALANLATLALFYAAIYGILDPVALLEKAQKDAELGLDRFSLGNAIEMPFMLSALLYAGVRGAPGGRHYVLFALVNIVAALVSQSRLVILIAVLILLKVVASSRPVTRFLVVAITVSVVASNWDAIVPLLNDIASRFAGNDQGSKEARTYLIASVLNNVTIVSTLIGSGLSSSFLLMQRVVGEYRTVESVLVQLLVEIGLVGIVLSIASARAPELYQKEFFRLTPILSLMWLQLLLFLPIFDIMPVVAFALGAASAASDRYGVVSMRRAVAPPRIG